ncbi:MAG: aldose 1-epimerase family protein [Bacteroidota bacterium]
MPQHKIENDQLIATIDEQGAQLVSLINKSNDLEYIWNADPKHWARRAPVLFPIVGKLKDDAFSYEGLTYQMSQHGFARDQKFRVSKSSTTSIEFLLESNAETRTKYPFDFHLFLTYTLSENELSVGYRVENPAENDLYFSIGGHPAFNCPLQPGQQRSDYSLKFEQTEDTEIQYLTDGLFAGAEEPFKGDTLKVTDDLFDRDALVFKSLGSNKVDLVDNQGKNWLTFDFTGFPYLGIWSKGRSSPFVCIEPWFGIADQASHDGNIKTKEGILPLKKDEEFECQYGIRIS